MQPIHLYQPNVYDLTVNFPTEWNELTTPELEAIAKFIISDIADIFTAKCGIFVEIFKLRTGDEKLIDKVDIEQLVMDGLPMLDFIFLKTINLKSYTMTKKKN